MRTSKEELIQLIGLVDGIRLYNDIHLKPLAPRLILYLAEKGETVFQPLLLQEVTVLDLVESIYQTFKVCRAIFLSNNLTFSHSQVPHTINNVIIEGPNRISIKLTDEFLK